MLDQLTKLAADSLRRDYPDIEQIQILDLEETGGTPARRSGAFASPGWPAEYVIATRTSRDRHQARPTRPALPSSGAG